MIGGYVSLKHNLKGPNLAIVTACSTATHNMGSATRMIQYGEADVMVAGGAEFATTPTSMSGFISARAMSTAMMNLKRPVVPGMKTAMVLFSPMVQVLSCWKSWSTQRSRGATIYAEVMGFGMSADALHMTAPPDDGEGAARCMRIAMNDAGVNTGDVDYINAHGTSTPLGDLAETIATKTIFGDAGLQGCHQLNQVHDGALAWVLRVVSKRYSVCSAFVMASFLQPSTWIIRVTTATWIMCPTRHVKRM